jgi:hypothetical protein
MNTNNNTDTNATTNPNTSDIDMDMIMDMNEYLLIQYLESLSPIERTAMEIAKRHLGSSFNILKSNGYMKWIKNNK